MQPDRIRMEHMNTILTPEKGRKRTHCIYDFDPIEL